MSVDGLWQVSSDSLGLCAGMVVKHGKVVEAAPILRRWWLGTDIWTVTGIIAQANQGHRKWRMVKVS